MGIDVDRTLAERDKRIAELEAGLAARDARIAELVAERDKTVFLHRAMESELCDGAPAMAAKRFWDHLDSLDRSREDVALEACAPRACGEIVVDAPGAICYTNHVSRGASQARRAE